MLIKNDNLKKIQIKISKIVANINLHKKKSENFHMTTTPKKDKLNMHSKKRINVVFLNKT